MKMIPYFAVSFTKKRILWSVSYVVLKVQDSGR